MNNNILYIVSEDWYFLSHRLSLAIEAKKKGYKVNVLCKDTGKINIIKNYGFNCYQLNSDRKNISIINLFQEVLNIRFLIKKLKPNIIHLVALRPIILGLASTFFNKKISIVVSITGLGSIFLSRHLITRIIKFITIFFLFLNFKKDNIKIIVQNKDDYNFVINTLHCKKKNIFLIRGSGVNIHHFSFQKEPLSTPIVLTYVGRLIKDKGIEVLINAFENLDNYDNKLQLILAGEIDYANPSAISQEYLNKKLKDNKNIKWLGKITDVKKLWNKSHIAVLASRREGLPKSLLEAAASGKPIIASDVPGCREIAINGVNAITFPLDDGNKLMEAIKILSNDKELRKKYGLKSREIVENGMSEDFIVKKTISVYEKNI